MMLWPHFRGIPLAQVITASSSFLEQNQSPLPCTLPKKARLGVELEF